MAHQFKAKYNGKCKRCGNDYPAGEMVRWDASNRTSLIHVDCKPEDKELPTPEVQDELEHAFLRGEFYIDPVIG